MKKLILLVLLALPFSIIAQNAAIESFYQKYKDFEELSDVTLKGWLLKATSSGVDKDDANNVLNKITYFRALIMEDGNLVKNSDYKSFMRAIKKDNFEELVKVKDKGSDIDILVRDQGDFITDAILVVSDEDQFILLSMEGRLKLSDFKDININIDGADHFKKAAQ